MVSRQDIRDINTEAQELIDAVDEMQELYEQSDKDGVTVSDGAYEDAQESVKASIASLWEVADDMVDRSDTYEPPGDEASPVSLPNAALSRKSDSTNPPENPGNS